MVELNPFGAYTAGRKLGMARRAEERLEEDRARAATTRNRLAEMLGAGMPTTPEAKRAVVSDLARSDPGMALDWSKHFAGMGAARLKQRQAEAPFLAAQLGQAKDQATYDAALKNLSGLGVDVSDMPPEYDPGRINMVTQAAKYLAAGGETTKLGEGDVLVGPSGEVIARGPEAAGGPFSGTALTGQAANILLSADPSSPEYAAAYSIMSQPRTYMDPGSGQIVSVAPDMAAFRPPTGRGAAPAAAPTKPAEPMGVAGEPAAKVKDVTPKPTTPAGMTVTPIPGSKAERERVEAAEAEKKGEAGRQLKARIVVDDLNRIEEMITESFIPATGFIGSMARRFNETTASDIEKLLPTIRASVGFDQLQAMREASKTGGALGPVSDAENKLLQAVLGTLDTDLSEDVFLYNLRRLREVFLDTIHGPGNRPGETESQTTTAAPAEEPTAAGLPQPKTKAERDALPSGTDYLDPNGVKRTRP